MVFFIISSLSLLVTAGTSDDCKRGVLDLSDFNYFNAYSVKLNGEWNCDRNKFNGTSIIDGNESQIIKVPGSWSSGKLNIFTTNQFGYCTYRLKILLPEKGHLWSLHLSPIHSAYKIFIDGRLMTAVGTPTAGENMHPAVEAKIITFLAEQKEIVISIEVSNYCFVLGGIINPITFGNPIAIQNERENSLIISAFLMGSLVIMGLYHFSLFLLWKKDKGFLYFGIICIFIALRESFGGEALFYKIFSSIGYEFSIKILYSCFPICMIAFTLFFDNLYNSFLKFFRLLVTITGVVYLFLIVCTPNPVYGKFLIVISVIFFFESIYLLIITARNTHKNPRENILVLIGLLVLISCFLNDVLYESEVIKSHFFLPFGFFLFTLFQSIILSIRFTKAFRKRDSLEIQLVKSDLALNEIKSNFQRELLKTQLEIQEQTFQNISQEIHDNVGQTLSLAKVQANTMEQETILNTSLLKDVKESISKAMADLRDIAKSLNSDHIRLCSLAEATNHELQRISKLNIKTMLKVEGQELQLPEQTKMIVLRIMQECLHNVLKHSQATTVEIFYNYQPEQFIVTVKDNGKGFDQKAPAKEDRGLGLQNIISRASLIGGNALISSAINRGTSITVILPYV